MNPVSLLMARYQDPDVTPRQAPAWRGEPAASPRNPVLPALITRLSDRLKRGARQLW